MNFLKGELLEIIEWTDDSRNTLSYRFPDEDKEIKRGAQLIVRESQVAQFVYLGQFGDTFGPGKYSLNTANIPVLSSLKGWKYGFETPFKTDIYYLTSRVFTGNKWGTSNLVMMRDADLGVVRIRAFGTYDFRIVHPQPFLREVAGTDQHFRLEEFVDAMRSRIVSVFSSALAASGIPVLDVARRYIELGEALLPLINPALKDKYEAAIDTRSSMAAVGNLNDMVKYQLAHGLAQGGAGVAGLGAEVAIGSAIAQQMLPPQSGSEVLSPADAARTLGVTESDVMASLEAGDLKGKKIGTQWRITRRALQDFLA
jgi:excisionase family DNA binding protein